MPSPLVPVLEWSPTTGPLDTPVWEDITAYLRTGNTSRGRASEFDQIAAGSLTVTLDGNDRTFDPAYNSDAGPGVQVRLTVPYGPDGLLLTGAATSYSSTPDVAALDITGDLDLRVKAAMDDWTPAANQVLICKGNSTAGTQVSFILVQQTSGKPLLVWTTGGTYATVGLSEPSSAVPVSNGADLWLRATLDVNNGAGGNTSTFYYSLDETDDHTQVEWTALGSPVVGGSTTSIFSGSAALVVGASSDAGGPLAGTIYAAAVLNGIAGTVVAAPNFRDADQFTAGASSGTDSTGKVWTDGGAGATIPERSWPIFAGWVDDLPTSYADDGTDDAVVTLTATDGFKALARYKTQSPVAEEVAADAPVLWYRLGDDPAATDIISDSGNGNGTNDLTVTATGATTVASLVDGTEDAAIDVTSSARLTGTSATCIAPVAQSRLLCMEAWISTTQSPSSNVGIASGVSPGSAARWGLGLSTTGTLRFLVTWGAGPATEVVESAGTFNDGATHHVVGLSDSAGTLMIYVDGVLEDSSAVGAVPTTALYDTDRFVIGYGFDGVIDEVAVYNGPLSTARITAHYEAGAGAWTGDRSDERIGRLLDLVNWPTALRDLEAGASLLQGASTESVEVLEHAQAVERTEQGRLFCDPSGVVVFQSRHHHINNEDTRYVHATVTDDGTGDSYTGLDTTFGEANIANDVIAQREGGAAQRVRDQASIDAYFQQTRDDLSGLLCVTDTEARALAQYVVDRYAQPATRVESLRVKPEVDPADLVPIAFGLDLGQRVQVTKTMAVGADLTVDAAVEGVTHDFDVHGAWTTDLRLSPLFVGDEYLVLDSATRGLLDTGKVAY